MTTSLSSFMATREARRIAPIVTVSSFAPSLTDANVDRFVAIGAVLQAAVPGRIVADLGKVASQLAPSFHFNSYGTARYFVAARDGMDVGRCSATINSRATRLDGTRIGCIGHWECADDDHASRALLDAAVAWLRDQGADEVWGPMDYSTWYSYRHTIGQFEDAPLLMEPYTPPHYALQWQRYGFELGHTYFSAEARDLTQLVNYSDQKLRDAVAAGYSFRMLDINLFDEALHAIYDLSVTEFSANPFYSHVDREEFLDMYRDSKSSIDPRMVIFAISPEGNVAGFVFCVPNYARAARELNGGMAGTRGKLRALRLKRKADSVLIKTIAVSSKYRQYGLGTVLAGRAHQAAIDLGYRRAHHMLMYESNISMIMSGHADAHPVRRYGLYQLPL